MAIRPSRLLVLARGASRDYVAMGSLLLDTCCLGINDVMFEAVGGEALADYICDQCRGGFEIAA